ncbi:MAG TPA: hypothetical protein V6C65_14860, partial [Allocoleopsis sp.]
MLESEEQNTLQTSALEPLSELRSYNGQLDNYHRIIENINLSRLEKEFLKARWLDQMIWMEEKSSHLRKLHNQLRVTTLIGSVIAPILITLNIPHNLLI